MRRAVDTRVVPSTRRLVLHGLLPAAYLRATPDVHARRVIRNGRIGLSKPVLAPLNPRPRH